MKSAFTNVYEEILLKIETLYFIVVPLYSLRMQK